MKKSINRDKKVLINIRSLFSSYLNHQKKSHPNKMNNQISIHELIAIIYLIKLKQNTKNI